jgi:hypothetical protein
MIIRTSDFDIQHNINQWRIEMITVRTQEELKAAKESGEPEIIIIGDLADKLKKSKKIALLGPAAIAALGLATVAAPITGGISYLAAAPVATMTGVEIAAIITATAIGVSLVLAIFKDYEEISYESGKLVLKKRSQ